MPPQCPLGGGYLLAPRDEVNSISTTDKTNQASFVKVKVGELFDSETQTFNKDNYNILLKYITGNASATLSDVTALAETNNNQFSSYGYTGTDCHTMTYNDSYVPAGIEGNTSYEARDTRYGSGKAIRVRLGGLDWVGMYLSKDYDGNTILTLWLDNSTQDAWINRSSTEGEYYGYVNGGLYSVYHIYSDRGLDESGYSGDNVATLYGTSYINAVTLNNGGRYITRHSSGTTVNVEKSTDSAFALFTMPQFGLTDFIVTPRKVKWQEYQYGSQLLSTNTDKYDHANERWSTEDTSDSGFHYVGDNFAEYEYSDAWADSYLWLPSLSEIGDGHNYGVHTADVDNYGLWYTSGGISENYDGSTSRVSSGTVGTLTDGVIIYSSTYYASVYGGLRAACWLRNRPTGVR